jgi:hypothetical protein
MVWGLAVAVSCGEDAETDGNHDGAPREGYPAGPYGVSEGSVIDDLGFTRPDDTPFSLGEVYANGHNRLLLVSTASGWCASCVEEQADLESLHDQYGPDGLFVLVSVFEDADFRPAGADEAESWRRRFGVSYQVVADEPFVLGAFYDRTATPMVMFVDVDTMQILRISTGWDPSAVEAIIRARL